MVSAFILFAVIIYLINLFFYIRAWVTFKEDKVFKHNSPRISILVPAYNEGVNIIESLKSILNQNYSNYDVVIINDGSSDDTVKQIVDYFELMVVDRLPYKNIDNHKPIKTVYSNCGITLLDKENGGKADALNAGFAYTDAEWILSVDGDTLLTRNCLSTLISKRKAGVSAIASMVGISNDNKIVNGEILEPKVPKNFVARVQWMEYYRSYILLRNSFKSYGAVTVIPGACSFIKAEMLLKTGGYLHNHLGEDMANTLEIHRQGGKIQFLNEILSWTEAPDNWKDLGKQRVRWFRGGLQSYAAYTDLLFSSKNKVLGWIILPYVWISDLFGCWIELIGICLSIFTIFVSPYNYKQFLLLWGMIMAMNFSNFMIALLFIKKKLKLFKNYKGITFVSFIEGFTYHYLYLYWILKAHLLEIFGAKRNWNKLNRKKILALKATSA